MNGARNNCCLAEILFFEASQVMVLLAAKALEAVLRGRFGIQAELCGSGAASVIAELATMAFLFLRLSQEDWTQLRQRKKKMQPWDLAALASLFCTIQFGFGLFVPFLEAVLHRFGWTALPQVPEQTATLLVLNACTLAPVTEELVFRGAALRLRCGGTAQAVAVTVLLFALAHGTLYQAVYAGLCGLVLGWLAAEYSLNWAILLHIFNNAVLGYALPRLLEPLDGSWGAGMYTAVCIAAAVLSVRSLAAQRNRIWAAVQSCASWESWQITVKNPVVLTLMVWNLTSLCCSLRRFS